MPISTGYITETGNVKANKSLGQHWLKDPVILDKIVDLAELSKKDNVLEIGPGTGNLTLKLIKKCHVIAVEVDPVLSQMLIDLKLEDFEIYNESILKFDFSKLPKEYKIVANIPYYLTSNLIRILADLDNKPAKTILLVQKEIAERLSAGPKDYSVLGLIAQYYFNVYKGPFVRRDLFEPIPKVDSMIVILEPKKNLPLNKSDSQKLFKLIKVAFSSKRKTLQNNLKNVYKNEIPVSLEKLKLNPKIRAQELSLDIWIKLFNLLH